MSQEILTAVIGGGCGLIGAVVGGLLGPTVSYWLSDKTRKMDLYKAVYPARVEAAQAFMKSAGDLFLRVHGSKSGTSRLTREDEKAEWQSLKETVERLEKMAWTLEWLLGIEVKNAAADFISDCRSKMVPARDESGEVADEFAVQRYGWSYRKLGEVVRRQIHLAVLEDAVNVRSRKPEPLSRPREG